MSVLKKVITVGSLVAIGVATNGVADDKTVTDNAATNEVTGDNTATTEVADDEATSLKEAFMKGVVDGSLKSYYFAQNFRTDAKSDSQIWANGGHLKYETAKLYGLLVAGKFQASYVSHINDDSGVTAGSMDATGAVLSEAYLQYDLYKTLFKGGRQHITMPLIANSGSRLIKESFEGYFLSNTDIPGTILSAGWVQKYQTRTDKSNYADNWFVDYETNGTGDPGDFYDVGDDGVISLYAKNTSLENLAFQAHYTNVVDEVAGLYADVKYSFPKVTTQPYLAAQYYYTKYDESEIGERDNNYLVGFKTGIYIFDVDLFGGYTTVGGSAGDARVYRGLGQGAYYQYTNTTKTAGVEAFEAGTDSFQIGIGYDYEKSLNSKLRFTRFDNPIENADLDEYTLNFAYHFSGMFENFTVSVDFSVLDYENDQRDATDLRSRLIYSF